METKIYHGNIRPSDFAKVLIAEFDHGNMRAQQLGHKDEVIVQIATRQRRYSGGNTALTVAIKKVSDGISVQVGKQSWLGIAASLGSSAFLAIRNPFNLLGRLDDIAQDIESLKLSETVWEIIDRTAVRIGASHELSQRLRRVICDFCNTPNEVGASSCIACGAPLGNVQPITCQYCGFVVRTSESNCPNCHKPL